jgi:hypothetical protein
VCIYVCICVYVCVCICICVYVCSPVSRVFQKAHADRTDNTVIMKMCSNKTAYHFLTKLLVA